MNPVYICYLYRGCHMVQSDCLLKGGPYYWYNNIIYTYYRESEVNRRETEMARGYSTNSQGYGHPPAFQDSSYRPPPVPPKSVTPSYGTPPTPQDWYAQGPPPASAAPQAITTRKSSYGPPPPAPQETPGYGVPHEVRSHSPFTSQLPVAGDPQHHPPPAHAYTQQQPPQDWSDPRNPGYQQQTYSHTGECVSSYSIVIHSLMIVSTIFIVCMCTVSPDIIQP